MKTRPGICNRKKRFASKEEAEAAALAAPFTLRVYRCSLCRQFHLTSRTKGMQVPRHRGGETGAAQQDQTGQNG